MEGGSLYSLLRSETILGQEAMLEMVRGISRGLNHLHLEKIGKIRTFGS